MSSRALRGLGWLLAAVLASGCGSPLLTVNVKSPAGANQGRPLYMVVRAVDSKRYLSETYAEVASKVVTPDETVLQTAVVYPGTTKSLRVKIPEESPVAVSFLFTTPDGAWQALLDAPVPRSVDFELLEGRIRTDANTPGGQPAKAEKEPAKEEKAPAAPEKLPVEVGK